MIITRFAAGLLVLVLFRWTPRTPRAALIYGALFALLFVIMLVLPARKHTGDFKPHV